MAGDIVFMNNRVWSSSSATFEDVMALAIRRCPGGETVLVQLLSKANRIRCLSIGRCPDRNVQLVLTECVLEAAQDKLQELRAVPTTHPEDIRILEDLVTMAKAHLSELRDHPT